MLNEKLKIARNNAGFNQDDIAKHLNVKRQTYSAYETAKSLPDAETLNKIAKFYNVSVDYLLGNTDVLTPFANLYYTQPSLAQPNLEELIKNSSEMTEDFKFMMLTQLKLAKLAYKMDNEHAEQLETPREPIFKNGRRILAT